MESTLQEPGACLSRVTATAEMIGAGFPGPLSTGVSLIAAPVLGMVGSALAIGIYNYKSAEMIAGMAHHHGRTTAAFNLAVAGVILMMLAVASVARGICLVRPRLGRFAGVLTIIGLAGPLFFEGMYWGASFLTPPQWRAAGAHLVDGTQVVPSTIVNVSGPALVFGFVLLAAGTARAGLFSKWRAVALGMAALLPVGFISGYIAVSAIGFAFASAALIPMGVEVLRTRHRFLGNGPR